MGPRRSGAPGAYNRPAAGYDRPGAFPETLEPGRYPDAGGAVSESRAGRRLRRASSRPRAGPADGRLPDPAGGVPQARPRRPADPPRRSRAPPAPARRRRPRNPPKPPNRAGRLRLRVNPITCDGHGLCAELLPELMTLDDWGYPAPIVAEIPPDLEGHAQRAAQQCPTLAIVLERRQPRPSGQNQ